jgi:hypothetical protein
MAVGIDDRMRELCVHLRGAEMTIAGQRHREARGNNADLNFTAPSCSAFFPYLHHSSAREDSQSGVQIKWLNSRSYGPAYNH